LKFSFKGKKLEIT